MHPRTTVPATRVTTHVTSRAATCGLVSLMLAAAASAAPPVGVTLHDAVPDRVSRLTMGITHTHEGLDQSGVNAAAKARAIDLLDGGVVGVQNTHILGWGVGDINPSAGVYNWSTLDSRVNLMNQIGAPQMMTIGMAPAWIKGTPNAFGSNGEYLTRRPLAEKHDEFAQLAVEVAKRYPHVRTFQVWNEMKGYWDADNNNWDYRDYTNMYNAVYDALKAHDPTLEVGGLYLVIEGTGSQSRGYSGRDTFDPIGAKNQEVIDYWLANKHGADFIAVDRGIIDYHDPNKNDYTTDDRMALTHWFGQITRDLAEQTDLPVTWSEYYAGGSAAATPALFASTYKHMAESGVARALLWNPNEGETSNTLFSDVTRSNGGMPNGHYHVYRMIAEHFGPGTPLHDVTVTSTAIEALVSDRVAMLVNKTNATQTVVFMGDTFNLAPYEVRFHGMQVIPEPAAAAALLGLTLGVCRRRTRR